MNASTDFMHTLAWALLHFLWQGAAIAALAAAFMYVYRKPATRYLVGVASIALMFMSFGATFASLGSATSDVAAIDAATPAPLIAPLAATPDYPAARSMSPVASQDELAWVAQIWLAGVCLLALRVAFGLLFLERLRRRNLMALPESILVRCRVLQQRLGVSRIVRYCECRLVSVPAVIGMFRPVVLLPMRALTGLTPEQLEAVIAHELGHIKRFDVAINFLQVIAETLFFFHPAVWWLNKRIRAAREECCDDMAMSVCGGQVGYARALATMESWRDVPEFAVAATGGSVSSRVARLLGVGDQNTNTRAAGVFTASLVLTVALSAGAISMGLVEPAKAGALLAQADAAPAVIAQQPAPNPKPAPAAKPATAAKPSPAAKPASAAKPANPANSQSPRTSYIDQMKAAGYDNLDVEHLVAMKVHDITPEYVRGVRDMGFNPDPEEVIAMKIHDITPEYVKSIRSLGFEADAEEIVAMKVQGITPEYVQAIRSMGFKPDAEEIVAMKVHDITPEYMQKMRSLGFEANAEELVALKVHEVTPEYRDALAAAGYKLNAEEIVQAKVMEITPEFIEEVRRHGFKDLTMEQLVQLKNADVL